TARSDVCVSSEPSRSSICRCIRALSPETAAQALKTSPFVLSDSPSSGQGLSKRDLKIRSAALFRSPSSGRTDQTSSVLGLDRRRGVGHFVQLRLGAPRALMVRTELCQQPVAAATQQRFGFVAPSLKSEAVAKCDARVCYQPMIRR